MNLNACATQKDFARNTQVTLHNGRDFIPVHEQHDPFFYRVTGRPGAGLDGYSCSVYRVRDGVSNVDEARKFAFAQLARQVQGC